jgi:hypothetical protein
MEALELDVDLASRARTRDAGGVAGAAELDTQRIIRHEGIAHMHTRPLSRLRLVHVPNVEPAAPCGCTQFQRVRVARRLDADAVDRAPRTARRDLGEPARRCHLQPVVTALDVDRDRGVGARDEVQLFPGARPARPRPWCDREPGVSSPAGRPARGIRLEQEPALVILYLRDRRRARQHEVGEIRQDVADAEGLGNLVASVAFLWRARMVDLFESSLKLGSLCQRTP